MRKVKLKVFKIIKFILISLISLLAFLMSLVLAVLIWPKLLINERTLRWGAEFAETQGITVQWKKVDIQIDSLALLRKHFGLYFDGLCVDAKKNGISGCVEELNLAAGLSFSKLIPRIIDLGPIDIKKLDWRVSSEKGEDLTGVFNLEGRENTRFELQGLGRWIFQFWGTANIPQELEKNSVAQARGDLYLNGDRLSQLKLSYLIDASYRQKKAWARAHLEGQANQHLISGKITGSALGWVPGVPKISLDDCDVKLEGVPEKRLVKQSKNYFDLNCPVRMEVPIPPKEFSGVHLPTEIGAFLKANLKMSTFLPSSDTEISGPIDLTLNPILTPLFLGKAELNSQVNGVLGEFPQKGSLTSRLLMSINLFSFEKLVSQLRNSAWAVPAPFHVLRGNGELKVEGESSLKEGNFPFSLKTQLASKGQSLDLDGTGLFDLKGIQNHLSPQLNFDLILSDVQIALPRLDWGVPPKVFPDSRFKRTNLEEEEEEPSSFKYQLTVKTLPGKPVRVLTNLTDAIIPVEVSINLSDSTPILGNVRVLTFPIEAFRRKAVVDHFALNIRSPMGDSPIHSSISVDYADYTVTVKLEGDVKKPILHLTSEPPLPENQLFAVLLFGQPLEELDSEQADSVGNTRAAVASGAVNLASLYVLASTPIQSVNYDPETKTVTAKIRLGDGTSLNVGTDTGSATVGVRRRLGPSWTIETELGNTADQRGVASAYLQWSRRY